MIRFCIVGSRIGVMMSRIVFTDLDGTLLDHDDYRYDGALPAIEELRRRGIPLVLCSSKTAAELEALQKELGLRDPFISENGGGIHFPAENRVVVLGTTYQELALQLDKIGERLQVEFQTMVDMTLAEVVAETGLPPRDAELARKRNFDLAFVVTKEIPVEALEREVDRIGFRLTRGARFFHLTGENDKGKAVRTLVNLYRKETGVDADTLGLGDSENDIPLLDAVDRPVIIPNPGSKAPLEPRRPGTITASRPAPEGWNDTVLDLLKGDWRDDP